MRVWSYVLLIPMILGVATRWVAVALVVAFLAGVAVGFCL
jgi:hypothetical protein